MDVRDLVRSYDNLIKLRLSKKEELRGPTFIGIGEGRCGTTSLYSMLSQHPDVYMSPVKEIAFFNGKSAASKKNGVTISEYLNYFVGESGQQHIGEISPQYIYKKNYLKQIKRHFPSVKILVTLRNPISRFLSHYKYFKAHGLHENISLKEYFEGASMHFEKNELGLFNSPARNLDRCFYSARLKWIKEIFGDDYLVLYYEDLVENPAKYVQKTGGYLNINVDESSMPHLNPTKEEEADREVIERLREYFKEEVLNLRMILTDAPESFFVYDK